MLSPCGFRYTVTRHGTKIHTRIHTKYLTVGQFNWFTFMWSYIVRTQQTSSTSCLSGRHNFGIRHFIFVDSPAMYFQHWMVAEQEKWLSVLIPTTRVILYLDSLSIHYIKSVLMYPITCYHWSMFPCHVNIFFLQLTISSNSDKSGKFNLHCDIIIRSKNG